jgi:hypothetical protein
MPVAAESPSSWDVTAAINTCPIQPWAGSVWRCHSSKYAGNDAAGSLCATGRLNRGADRFEAQEIRPALYTSLALHVALGERLRHTTAATLKMLANQRMSRLRVELEAVLILCAPGDCAEFGTVGLDMDRLCRPADYEMSHQVAAIARNLAEAMVVPSCTKFPEGNLIIFPDRLQTESVVEVVEILDPDLFVDWDNL